MTDRPDTVLTARLETLADVVDVGEGVLPESVTTSVRQVIANATGRLRHGTGFTVVALAGATGSGKSSLFNAIVGEPVAATGVRRPTTAEAQSAVFGDHDADALLDWLGIRHRHRVTDAGALDGLVLIDLPDHDSVEVTHRMQVDRFVQIVDLLIWVVDPQKYADQILHERYLAPLAKHADVMVFLLHQSDLLSPGELERLQGDLLRLLDSDGIDDPAILSTSTVSTAGLDQLSELLAQRIAGRRTALDRIDADLVSAVDALQPLRSVRLEPPGSRDVTTLVDGLAEAAGSRGLGDVVGEGYRHRATLRTGWPFTRWIRRLRRNPLSRLTGTDETGKPTAAPIDEARLDLALKSLADEVSEGAPAAWQRKVRRATGSERAELIPAVRAAVTTVVGRGTTEPRWWGAAAVVQSVLGAAALAGAVWLVGLWLLDWLRVPSDSFTPEYRGWPIPTLLVLGGLGAGLIATWVIGLLAAAGSRRRASRIHAAIRDELRRVADEHVIEPTVTAVERWRRLDSELDFVAGRT